jgi:hypothetical protein
MVHWIYYISRDTKCRFAGADKHSAFDALTMV